MAIKWKDVIAKPEFQALSPEQKAQAQEQYFNEVVAPQAGNEADAAKQQFYSAYPKGLLERGNIDIHKRPIVKNADGSISTVRSMSTNIDGREVLIPTVSDDGRIMSDDEAIDTFMKTGRHLGMFDNPDDATKYAESLHNEQASEYLPIAKQNNAQQAQKQQQPQQEEPGLLSRAYSAAKEAITGSERMTPEMEQLKAVGDAPELNELSMNAFRAGLGQLFGSQKSQEQILQSMGGKIHYDAKGNAIVDLPSGSYAVNKPGLSPQDVTGGIAEMLSFTPAGRAATIGRAALGAGATETALRGAVQAAGGEAIDPGDVAISAGLGGAGKAVESAAGGIYRALKGAPSAEQQAAINFAEQAGAPLMTTDVVPPQTFIGKSAQSAAEKIPIAGTGAPRAAQQQVRSQLVEDYAKKFGDYRPEDVVASLQRQTSKVKQAAGNSRQRLMEEMEGKNFTPENAIRAIDDEIDRLSMSPSGTARETADNQTINTLRAYKKDLEADPSFRNIEELRTTFRENVKGERIAGLNNRSQAAVDRIYSSMTKDMDESIKSSLGDDAYRKWKQSNAVYAGEMQKIKGTRIKNALQKGDLTPEVVNNMIYSNKPSEVRALYTSLDTKGKNAMRAGIIGKAWEKSGGSPDRFLNQLNSMGDSIGITFKGADRDYVNGLKSYLQHTQQAGRAGVMTPTGQQIFQIGAPTALIGDISGTGGVGTMGAAAYGGIARLYESKPVRNAIVRLNSIKKGTTAFEQQARKVQAAMTAALQSETRE